MTPTSRRHITTVNPMHVMPAKAGIQKSVTKHQGVRIKYYTYILASKRNGTLYTGMTNNLRYRSAQHKTGVIPGFTSRYGVKLLVYFEEFNDPRDAIAREKQLKWWKRKWKLQLIESVNPEWRDLSIEL